MRVCASSGRYAHRFELEKTAFARIKSRLMEWATTDAVDERIKTSIAMFASREMGGFSRAECVRLYAAFVHVRRAFECEADAPTYDDFFIGFKIASRKGGSMLYC